MDFYGFQGDQSHSIFALYDDKIQSQNNPIRGGKTIYATRIQAGILEFLFNDNCINPMATNSANVGVNLLTGIKSIWAYYEEYYACGQVAPNIPQANIWLNTVNAAVNEPFGSYLNQPGGWTFTRINDKTIVTWQNLAINCANARNAVGAIQLPINNPASIYPAGVNGCFVPNVPLAGGASLSPHSGICTMEDPGVFAKTIAICTLIWGAVVVATGYRACSFAMGIISNNAANAGASVVLVPPETAANPGVATAVNFAAGTPVLIDPGVIIYRSSGIKGTSSTGVLLSNLPY